MAKSQAKSTAQSTVKEFTNDCERHLKYSVVKDKFTKADHDEYYSLSLAVRDRIIDRWFSTQSDITPKIVSVCIIYHLNSYLGECWKTM